MNLSLVANQKMGTVKKMTYDILRHPSSYLVNENHESNLGIAAQCDAIFGFLRKIAKITVQN